MRDLDVFLTLWVQKFSQGTKKHDVLCILTGFLEILLVLLLLLLLLLLLICSSSSSSASASASSSSSLPLLLFLFLLLLLLILLLLSWIFFQNAFGILGESLGAFGEILVKVSLLKRASRSNAKTGL